VGCGASRVKSIIKQTSSPVESVRVLMSEITEGTVPDSRPASANAGPSLGDVFSTDKPKDALDGIASGISNVTKGIFGGIAMVVAGTFFFPFLLVY
jgi:hypothetical protein